MSHKKNLVALAILMVLTTLFAASNVGPYNILPKIVPALAVACPTGGSANPCLTVSLDIHSSQALSASPCTPPAVTSGQGAACDNSISFTAANVTTFRVGGILNASSTGKTLTTTNCFGPPASTTQVGCGVFSWQFGIKYDPTVVTAQGDPNAALCTTYPECPENTIWYGSQTGTAGSTSTTGGQVNWAGFTSAQATHPQSFSENPAAHTAEVLVGFSLVAPSTGLPSGLVINARNTLASVAFELVGKGDPHFQIVDVIFSDANAVAIPFITAAPLPSAGPTPPQSALKTDALIKYVDANANGVWNIGESIVRDSGTTVGSYDTGDVVLAYATPTVGAALVSDPKVKFVDNNGDNVWTGALQAEAVVYDNNTNNLFDNGELIVSCTPFVSLLNTGSCGAPSSLVANDPPHASFTTSRTGTSYTFTSTSTDDVAVASNTWDFGDGSAPQIVAGATSTVTHDYATSGRTPGKFTATLRVTDSQGATGTARDAGGAAIVNGQPSHSAASLLAEQGPTAAFTFTPTNPTAGSTVSFDGRTSTYPDEPLLSGTAPLGGTALANGDAFLGYVDNNANGVFDIGVDSVVHDNNADGLFTAAADTVINGPVPADGSAISEPAVGLGDPKIAFVDANANTVWDAGEIVIYDHNGNLVYDGIVKYAWNFGDPASGASNTATGSTATHVFNPTVTTTFTVALNVTDNIGGFNIVTHTVTVTVGAAAHPTTTSVTCTGPVVINQASTCSAIVKDTSSTSPTSPLGTVAFTNGGTATGSFTGSPCTLAVLNATASTCSVTFNPTSTGTLIARASYTTSDTTRWSNSGPSTSNTVTVNKRATTTAATCTPSSAVVSQSISCTGFVKDTSAGTASAPLGSVAFTNGGTAAGSFTGSPCTLASLNATTSSCVVTFAPTGAGTVIASATYTASDTSHLGSGPSTSNTVNVALRTTSTAVTCTPSAVVISQSISCTGFVKDTSVAGTASAPLGTVAFTNGGTATGTFTGSPCTLASVNATTSSCNVTFTPTGAGTVIASGTYASSDTTHSGSGPTAGNTVTVTKRTTTTAVTCSPSSVSTGQATTCTSFVKDTSAGTASAPLGTVAVTNTGSATAVVSGSPCTLASINATTSSCNVTITASTTGTIIASSTYTPTDTSHLGSGPSTSNTVTVGGRPTTTAVTCTPSSVVVSQVTTCSAFVKDVGSGTPTAPGGTVAFTNGGTAGGSFTGSPCTLASLNTTTSSCNVTFNPTSAGNVVVSASYTSTDGSHTNSASTVSATVTVTLRTTSTSVSCTPTTVVVAQVVSCTGFAKDTSAAGTASAPAGSIAFTNGGTATGSFTGSPCTLAVVNATTRSCTVTFNPTASGTLIASGTYSSTDTAHSGSGPTAGNTVTVNRRTTSTAVSCTPASVVVNQVITCTGFAKDTSAAGTASAPAGTVAFTNGGTAAGTFTGSPCTLASVNATTSSCTVTFNPTSAGTVIASGTYTTSDAAHAGSGPTAGNTVNVALRTTSTAVTCAPTSVATGVPTTCTSFVKDTSVAGTASAPLGTVAVTNAGTATAVVSGSPCTLASVNATTSSCNVTITASTTGTIVASSTYTPTDTAHSGSGPSLSNTVTVGGRQTSTAVTCTPTAVVVSQAITCTGFVKDIASGTTSAPGGTLAFTNGGTATGSFTGSPCTLASVNITTSSCNVTFTPTGAGTVIASGTYTSTDSIHSGSGPTAGNTVTVTRRTTSTAVSCTPATVVVTQVVTCTGFVKDTSVAGTASAPLGTVAFTNGGTATGTFTGSPCTLATVNATTSSCNVTFNPTASGTIIASGTYTSTDTAHLGSGPTAGNTVTVNRRTTSTAVSCTPATVVVSQVITCTGFVKDTSVAGTASAPLGTVAFTNGGTAAGSFTGSPCTLASVNATTSSCNVTFSPTNAGTVIASGTYTSSDAAHNGSGPTAGNTVTVTLRPTSTIVTCSPTSVTTGQTVTCTTFVKDIATAGTASAPAGTVAVSNTGTATPTGSFTGSPCTLAAVNATTSSCALTITPTGSGTIIATSTYTSTDTSHSGSGPSNSNTVTVGGRSTSTAVTCSPAAIVVAQATTCTGFIKDTASGTTSAPGGTVAFTNGGTATGSFTGSPCTLATVNATTSSCNVTFTPTGAGTVIASGTYTPNDNIHSGSGPTAGNTVTVTRRTTTTAVSCTPAAIVVSQATTCTGFVKDTSAAGTASAPAGTVAFTNGGTAAGSFTGSPCTLGSVNATTSSCNVTFTPTGAGTVIASGTYTTTDAAHSGSGPTTGNTVTVTLRTTSTAVSCSPATVVVAQTVTCAGFVKDTSAAGTASAPLGTVAFTNGGTATGSFTGSPCTLASVNATTSSCNVTFNPTSSGTIIASGTYTSSDIAHSGSGPTAGNTVTVNRRTTSTAVTCAPSTVVVAQVITCTGFVKDTSAAGTASAPLGTVALTNGGTATGSFTGSPCTLASVNATTSSCNVTFTPTGAGTVIASGTYTSSDVAHLGSGPTPSNTVTVNLRSTTTIVNCTPNSIAVGQTTTCTAFVKDSSAAGTPSAPAGSVAFTNTGSATGTFSGTPCTLASVNSTTSSCAATIAPTTSGTVIASTTYTPSDTVHSGSTGTSNTVTVGATRSTSIVVTCSPSSIVVSQATTCTGFVRDTAAGTASAPGGTVSFTNGGTSSGSFTGSPCTLASVNTTVSSCNVTFTPTSSGTVIASGTYNPTDGVHTGSGPTAGNTVTVTLRTTSTAVSCTPATVVVAQTVTCTGFVKDTSAAGTASAPLGTVAFTNGGTATGSFSGSPCTLASVNATTSSCNVTFNPTSSGTIIASGTYTSSDTAHSGSGPTASNTVTVNRRTTSTAVTCTPATVVVAQATTCTGFVKDTSTAGTASAPLGSVAFTNGGTATGSFTGSPCALAAVNATTSSCNVTFTPTSAGTIIASGTYTSSDAAHSGSGPTAGNTVTVTLRPTSTVVTCSPTSVSTGQLVTCTAFVKDMATAGTTSTPAGTVAISNTGTATPTGAFTGSPCTLASVNATTSRCALTITPTSSGTIIATATYTSSDTAHSGSGPSNSNTVTVGGRATSIVVSCSPSTVVVSQATSCMAFVKDIATGTATAPLGTVSFSNGGTATGSFTGAPCTLASVNTTTSSCSASFTPTSAGTLIDTSSYTATDGTHSNSGPATSNTVTVTLRTTSTAVSCTPATAVIAQVVTCTGFVRDTSAAGTASAPLGTVAFTNGGTATGSFTGSPCTVASVNATVSSCNVTFTATGAGTLIASGTYTSTDTAHSGSGPTAGNTVTINLRTTSTAVSCTPASVVIGQATTCTGFVKDTSVAGTASAPLGTVAFTNGGTATGSFTGSPCTLAAVNATTSSCNVTFAPTSTGTVIASGTYTPSDAKHSGSGPTAGNTVTVGLRSTTSVVNCTPASVSVGQTVTCTAFIKDSSTGTTSAPGGSVAFTNSGTATGTFTGTPCTLASVNATTSSCSATIAPSTAGTVVASTVYTPNDNIHSTSNGTSNTVSVGGTRPTTTAITCSPSTVVVSQTITCTAFVKDTGAGTASAPGGTVAFTNGGTSGGSFTGTPCTLASVNTTTSSCNVTFVPTTAGTVIAQGTYTATDGVHSSGVQTSSNTVTVALRTTSTAVSCTPATVVIAQTVTCTGFVKDTSAAGTASAPSGTVGFTNGGTATGSFIGSPCTLASVNATTSSCNVTITPTSSGTIIASGTYTSSDTAHSGSGPTAGNTVTVNRRTTSTAVTCSPASIVVGQSTSCTGFVKDTSAAGTASAPLGTVAFTNGGTAAGSFTGSPCTLASVNATTSSCNVTFTPTSTGTVIASGTYTSSDAAHSGSGPTASNTVNVGLRSTSTVATCSPASVAVGQTVTCTAFVKDISTGTASAPLGTVAFTNGGTATGTFTGTPCTLASVNATTSSCSATIAPSSSGTVVASVSYSPTDNVHSASTGSSNTVSVGGTRATTTSVTCSPSTVFVGQTVTCTAFVKDTGAGTASAPGGTVSFSNTGSAVGSFTGTPCTLASVNTTTSRCSATITPSTAGTIIDSSTYTATDGVHAGSGPATSNTVTVNLRGTSTVVSCAPNAIVVAQSTTCTAFVRDVTLGGSAPAGTVSFTNVGTATATLSGSPCTLSTVNATTSSCFVSVTPSSSGNIIASASYISTDTSHSGSLGTSNTVNVTLRTTSTAVSCAPATVVVAQTVTCTGFVKDTSAAGTTSAPLGTVAFTNGGTATGSFIGSPCTLASVNATTSSCNVTITPTSSGTIIASGTYTSSDTAHSGSGPTAGNTVTVNRRTTSTAVTCSPSSVAIGQSVSCSATATDTSIAGTASAPAGTVSFTNSGSATGSFTGSPCTLASVSTTASSCSVTFTPTGQGTVIASGTYTSTDAAHSGSGPTASNTVTVGPRTTSTAVICSPSSVITGQTVTCTALVKDTSLGTPSVPTGAVAFTNSGTASGSFTGSPCTLATVNTTTASCSVTIVPTSTGTIVAVGTYSPSDTVHSGSQGTSNTVNVSPSVDNTTTTVNCNPASVTTGMATSCTATVKDTATTPSTPTGSVSFTSSGTGTFSPSTTCSLTTIDTMTASCSVSYTPTLTGTGVHTINGTYTPDAAHRRSSGTFALTVVDRPPVASFTESATQVPTGTTITFDARASTDPDGTIVSYAWNFGDGMTATGATTSHAYAKAGSYTVVLTVTDNSGSTNMASAMKTITDRAPTASFTFSPTSPTVGQTVAFDASSSFDPDGTITTYAWDFGDGVTGSGVTTTHAYSSTGTFTVTLIVTDDAGLTGTAQATITVQPTGAVCAGCHVSFFQWSLRTQWKKFSISQQGPLQNGADPIQAFAVNDGNQTVWSYVKFTVTGDSGVNQVLYTQIVQLTPGQQINGNQDPRFSANFVPTTPGTYFIQATVYFSNSSTQPPINDSTFTTSPPNNNATFSFIVRP